MNLVVGLVALVGRLGPPLSTPPPLRGREVGGTDGVVRLGLRIVDRGCYRRRLTVLVLLPPLPKVSLPLTRLSLRDCTPTLRDERRETDGTTTSEGPPFLLEVSGHVSSVRMGGVGTSEGVANTVVVVVHLLRLFLGRWRLTDHRGQGGLRVPSPSRGGTSVAGPGVGRQIPPKQG